MKKAYIEIAGPFAESDIEALKQGFDKMLGEKLEYEIVHNDSLIGGFSAKIDGKIYDASMLTHLEQIDRLLTKGDDWK